MEKPDAPRRSWWGRQSLLCKILLIAIPLIVVIGLAVGLGVGLTVCRGCGADTASSAVWQPAVGSTWQIVLSDTIKLSSSAQSTTPQVQVWDVDMFETPKSTIDKLHSLDSKVICYFSAGTYEPGRPDSADFKAKDKGKELLPDWPGEFWLNLSSPDVRTIMSKRIDIAQSKGCDAIDPDNVDGYSNDNGLGLTKQNSIDFVKFLASEARSRGMSTGLKNAGEIIPDVLSDVAFSVNEQCHEYQECSTFAAFTKAGKPVFDIEYPDSAPSITTADFNKFCSTSGTWGTGAKNFSIALKTFDLDGFVKYCDGKTYTTPLSSD